MQILGVIQLVDETDDTGPIWDTKSTVVPIQWWHGPENGTLVDHAGFARVDEFHREMG